MQYFRQIAGKSSFLNEKEKENSFALVRYRINEIRLRKRNINKI